MKNKEIVLLIISVVVISFFFYMNFSLCNKDYPTYNTSNYNYKVIEKSSSYNDKKMYHVSNNSTTSDYSDEPILNINSNVTYKNISANTENFPSMRNSIYNDLSYSHNNMIEQPDILNPSFNSYESRRTSSSRIEKNSNSISTTTNLSNGSLEKTNNYNDHGYDDHGYDCNGYNDKGYGHDGYNHEGYDCDGYDRGGHDHNGHDHNENEHNDNGCGDDNAVPVGDGTIILISLLVIYVPIKLLKLKKLKKIKI